jgi:hypothetical protein
MGILKCIGNVDHLTLSVGEATVTFPVISSLYSIVIVNLIGGLSFTTHAFMTIRFKKNEVFKKVNEEIDSDFSQRDFRELNKLEFITGIFTILISCWFLLFSIVMMASFENKIMMMLPLFIVSIIGSCVFSLLPIVLVGKNLALNSKVKDVLDERKLKKLRMKIQEGKNRK